LTVDSRLKDRAVIVTSGGIMGAIEEANRDHSDHLPGRGRDGRDADEVIE